jgi:hypothetical protein
MNPGTEEMLMMRPRSRARMCGRTALVIRMRPKTLTSKTPCAWATELSSAAPAPALLARTPMRPNRPVTCRATALAGSSLVTSRSRNITPSRGVTREVLRLVPVTWKPAAASASAAALPMPEDAAVTSATGRVAVIRDSRYY